MAIDVQESRELKERVVEINRVAKVVKGGRASRSPRSSWWATRSIASVSATARRARCRSRSRRRSTTRRRTCSPCRARADDHARVARALRRCPRAPAPGLARYRVIAGGGVRAVLELGGIRDVLAKSLGTTNPINMLKAAEQALRQLRRPEEVAKARGKSVSDVLPVQGEGGDAGWRRRSAASRRTC